MDRALQVAIAHTLLGLKLCSAVSKEGLSILGSSAMFIAAEASAIPGILCDTLSIPFSADNDGPRARTTAGRRKGRASACQWVDDADP
jgi:hypothetical protein